MRSHSSIGPIRPIGPIRRSHLLQLAIYRLKVLPILTPVLFHLVLHPLHRLLQLSPRAEVLDLAFDLFQPLANRLHCPSLKLRELRR